MFNQTQAQESKEGTVISEFKDQAKEVLSEMTGSEVWSEASKFDRLATLKAIMGLIENVPVLTITDYIEKGLPVTLDRSILDDPSLLDGINEYLVITPTVEDKVSGTVEDLMSEASAQLEVGQPVGYKLNLAKEGSRLTVNGHDLSIIGTTHGNCVYDVLASMLGSNNKGGCLLTTEERTDEEFDAAVSYHKVNGGVRISLPGHGDTVVSSSSLGIAGITIDGEAGTLFIYKA